MKSEETVFDVIRSDRLLIGKSLRGFSTEVGVNASFYSRIERGLVNCPDDIFSRICNVLGYDKERTKYMKTLLKLQYNGIKTYPVKTDISFPVFICTIDGTPPSEELAKQIATFLTNQNNNEK